MPTPEHSLFSILFPQLAYAQTWREARTLTPEARARLAVSKEEADIIQHLMRGEVSRAVAGIVESPHVLGAAVEPQVFRPGRNEHPLYKVFSNDPVLAPVLQRLSRLFYASAQKLTYYLYRGEPEQMQEGITTLQGWLNIGYTRIAPGQNERRAPPTIGSLYPQRGSIALAAAPCAGGTEITLCGIPYEGGFEAAGSKRHRIDCIVPSSSMHALICHSVPESNPENGAHRPRAGEQTAAPFILLAHW